MCSDTAWWVLLHALSLPKLLVSKARRKWETAFLCPCSPSACLLPAMHLPLQPAAHIAAASLPCCSATPDHLQVRKEHVCSPSKAGKVTSPRAVYVPGHT